MKYYLNNMNVCVYMYIVLILFNMKHTRGYISFKITDFKAKNKSILYRYKM